MTGWIRLLLPPGVTLSRSEGSASLGDEMLRCAQHDRAVLLLSPLRHLMSFSSVDVCSSTLAVARFKRYKRRILAPNKHAHNQSIAVLKNPMQNEAYMTPIQ